MKIIFNKKNKKILTNKCGCDYVAIEQAASRFLTLFSEAKKNPKAQKAVDLILNNHVERIAHIYSYAQQYDFNPSINNYMHLTHHLNRLHWAIGILEFVLDSSHDESQKK